MQWAIVVLVFLCAAVAAADNKDNISDGLENVAITESASRLVPKGADISIDKGIVKVESIAGFTGRKIEELERRINLLEQKLKDMESKLMQLQLRK